MPGETAEDRARSSAQIDAASYKILYEFERRLSEKLTEARTQTKEDIAGAIAPVLVRLDNIDRRMDEGNLKFTALDRRADDHSDRIDEVPKLIQEYNDRKKRETKPMPVQKDTDIHHRKRTPWWFPLLMGGALAFVGERLARFVINGLSDASPIAVAAPPAPSSTPPPTNSININMEQKK